MKMELHIALIRGGSAQNGEPRLSGVTDKPLTEAGARLIHEKSGRGEYPSASLVFSSGLLRCVLTAQIIYPGVPAVILKDLRAFDYGDFEDAIPGIVQENEQFAHWAQAPDVKAFPNGEEPYAFLARCASSFRHICLEAAGKGIEDAAVVTHKLVIQTILQRFTVPRPNYVNWDIPCAGGYLLRYETTSDTAVIDGGF